MSVRRHHGFTMIELLIAMAVLAMITAFAVPSFRALMLSARMTSLGEEVQSSLALARTTAAVQRRNIIWVHTGTGWEMWRDFATTVAGGTQLSQQVITQPGVVLQVLLRGATPALTTTVLTGGLRFDATGVVVRNDTGAAVDVVFRVCSSDAINEIGRDIQINRLGRMFIAKHTASTICNPV